MTASDANNPQIRKFVNVQKALKGASYPARKEELLRIAKGNGADEDVMVVAEIRSSIPDASHGHLAATT